MPQFHQMMGERLRSAEQGADTIVWLGLSRAAAKTRSGQFFQGEQDGQVVSPHLDMFLWFTSSILTGKLNHLAIHCFPPVCLCYRSPACFNPPASGVDTQLSRRHSEFHDSAGYSGQSHPVATWCSTQWTKGSFQAFVWNVYLTQ